MATLKPVELPLAALHEDMNVYPRHAVDPMHVASLADALHAGAQLPPLIVERKSNRLVDGWHRYRAIRRVAGETATAAVIQKDYESEAELLLDAIALNSAHGRKLDRMDQARAVFLAEKAGANIQAISVVLHVPEAKVQKLRVRIGYAPTAGPGTITGDNAVTLKRPAFHLAGKTLSAAQVTAHESMPGTSLLLPAKQLRLAITSGLIDTEDDNLRNELRALAKALGEWLQTQKKRAA